MLNRLSAALGGAVIAAVTGAYILWGPSGKKKSKDTCPGLLNVGNSCFLNSLLQAWAACPSLHSWLYSSVDSGRSDVGIANTIYNIMRVLNNEVEEAPDPYNPSRVLQDLRARSWVITSDEQDAHELFHVLTETLDEETSRYPSVLSLFDVKHLEDPQLQYQPVQSAMTRSQSRLPCLPPRFTDQPTRGLLASQLQCLTCGSRSPVKYDVFDSISLTIPHNYWGPLSVEVLLKQFITPEVVQDVDCPSCRKLSQGLRVKSNFRKKISIGKLPQILCIHLQRTQWLDNGAVVKRQDHVAFPDTLLMDQYLYSRQRAGGDTREGLMGGADTTLNMLSQSARPHVPTSAPVNLLRTLNFDTQLTQTGLFVHQSHTSPQIPQSMSDVNHNAPPEIFKSGVTDFAYKLAAVINHLGDIDSGHFTAYRKGIHKGGAPDEIKEGSCGEVNRGGSRLGVKWWLTSDSQVQRVSLNQVLSSEAYMLFYERL